ncbi:MULTISPECIES: aldose 1-epimerase family protein [unclassified Curtobacterium]|uniref:aldose 1-epimerase family protein n=1 Tax=unclassified Curtobacterium TaxID=257496 RepID=UPI000DA7E46B|nr:MULTISPECIES: aldose 1-epimerase family protein [unclassified Curtobacterium]PZE24031.1 galactose mutarotase [Curtobacterium sp. MCBD17_028]PZF56850.1 galactose mutarotase [Curtobacterium sp. MCBD17_034]PZM33806.1 galactose mutarotase [Curtobacterium sp. MCBD17_031]WIE55445.1 aldose 1-epimerase family protein [Curtobacterium sp. MCBD17_003]
MSASPRTADTSSQPLSGTECSISAGPYTATIASIGATLRSLRYDGRDLVVPFDADEVRPVFRGAVLAPWPNRVVDGRYSFAGQDHLLALSEPERGHALHGLVAWADFAVAERADDRVVLTTTIPAQLGYPFRVEVAVTHQVDEQGLHTTITGTNTGPDAAPWGTGPHPYLVAGPGHVDDWTLHLPAQQVLEVTPDRLVPTALSPVADVDDGVFDLRVPERIGSRFIDHAFTGFDRDGDGTATVRVTAADGSGVRMTFGPECPWVQVHTADHVVPEYHRVGLAVEPMTCAPDAFNAGAERGLLVVEPGESATASWTIAAV